MGIGFMENSVLTGDNVVEAFELLIKEIYEKTSDNENVDDNNFENEQLIELNTSNSEKKTGCR